MFAREFAAGLGRGPSGSLTRDDGGIVDDELDTIVGHVGGADPGSVCWFLDLIDRLARSLDPRS
jgi:hypothetical protein